MSRSCINKLLNAGLIDAARAADAERLIGELEQEYLAELGEHGAAIRAELDALHIMKREAAEKRRQTLISITREQKILHEFRRTADRLGVDRSKIIDAIIDSTGMDGVAFDGAEQVRKNILGRAHSRFSEVLATFRRDLVGETRNKAKLMNVVREAFGHNTGDRSARELAKAWYETAEFLRGKFNEAGGHIGKLDDWGLPQSHDEIKIKSVPYEEWRDFIAQKLDRKRMIDGVTGLPFTRGRLELELRKVYQTLSTDGYSKITPGAAGKRRAVGNRRSDHRFLHFRTADDWFAYQERFGNSDVFSTMMAHVDSMARDIGLMEVLGPNPAATLKNLQESLVSESKHFRGTEAEISAVKNRANSAAARLNVLYDTYTGAANAPVDGHVARGFAATRSFLTAAHLGSAALTAITDIGFGRLAAKHAGLPHWKVMKRGLQLMVDRGDLENQKLAVRLGLIAENWSQVASAQMRYVGEISGNEVTQRLSDFVLRASGLSPWTQANRWAFGMEFMGALADYSGRGFKDLPSPLQKTFEKYNIKPEDWDLIRQTEIYEPDKGGFLRPDDIAARDDVAPERANDLANRVLSMINGETEFAVPSVSLRGRATLGGATRPGSLPGELLRSTLMYKNFAISLYNTHMMRMINQQGLYNKTKYAASLMMSTTLLGGLAIQLKELSRGKDLRKMTGEHAVPFAFSAMLQGGGLSIFGDFIFSDVNRFGGSWEQTVAGPVVGFGTDIFKLTGGNLRQLMQGENTAFGAELANFIRGYTPGGSIWYARLAFERAFVDQIQLAIDPDAKRRFRRTARRLNNQMDQGYFWPKGELLPERAPNFSVK